MRVTEVRIKLTDEATQQGNDRLRAFCSVTFDNAFVVRDVRLIEGVRGLFVAMPSRKLTDRCPSCRNKNPLTARYCNNCGKRLPEGRIARDAQGRPRLHQDVAHPINQRCRDMIQQAVIKAFYEELERAKQPGYVSRYDDPFDVPHSPHLSSCPPEPTIGSDRATGSSNPASDQPSPGSA